MAKLTKWMRENIANRAVDQAFASRREAQRKAEHVLAREAYAFIIPKSEADLVSKLPENWMRREISLVFNVGGQRITLHIDGDGLPVPYRRKGTDSGGYYTQILGAIPHGDLCDRIQAHAQSVEALKAERKSAHRQVEAMLASVSTTNRLKEVWPEGEPFYSEYDAAPANTLPAIPVAEINQILGLAKAA